jgi:serine/threonine-protein kinase
VTVSREKADHRFGNYEILAMIGKGGMAEVYRGRVLSGPRENWPVAIKRLLPELARDPGYVDLFASEADLTRFLDHPNIVKVYEVGVLDEVYFIAMEHVDGRDLGQVLRRCKQRGIPLPIDFAVFLARSLLEALAYAHQAKDPQGKALGLVHCDVSPSNLFISRTGEIKLGDFGVARGRTAIGTDVDVMGKPYYLSPEAIAGKVTPHADLWAATVTLYELLTLERPFVGKNPQEVCAAITARRHREVRELRPEISPELEAIVERGFAADPARRFQSAAEYAHALDGHFDPNVGTPLAIGAVVRGLFGT